MVFPVQHCLNGTWQDGDRLLKVDHVLQTITATVHQGTLCDEHCTPNGDLQPRSFSIQRLLFGPSVP